MIVLGRPSAAVDRRDDPVGFAHVPPLPAFAIEVRGSSSPRAVWAINDTVAIFDFKLHPLGVYVTLANGAYECPAEGRLCRRRARSFVGWLGPQCLLPSGRTFVVNLRQCGFGSVEWVVAAVLACESVVVFIELEHAFEFALRRGFPLPQNRLLDLGVEAKVARAVIDTLYNGDVDISAQLP